MKLRGVTEIGILFWSLGPNQANAFVGPTLPIIGRSVLPVDTVSASLSLHTPAKVNSGVVLQNHHGGGGGEVLEAGATVDLSHMGILGNLMQSPVFWTASIMLSIVALLVSWERAVISARNSLPETLQPVVDSMLVEMGGLGFIGLFLSVAVTGGPLGGFVGAFSETFLGDEEILLESFEFLHTAFFQVATAFFLIASATVLSVVDQVKSLEMVSRAIFDLDGDGEVTLSEVAEVLNVESVVVDLDGDGILDDDEIELALEIAPRSNIWKELFRSQEDAKAEALMVRERLLIEYDIEEETFKLENYFVKIFGRNLEEMVELSPLTWLPLIPVVAQGRSIDLAHDVVSASSPNAFLSVGEFISAPGYVAAVTIGLSTSLIWAIWNYWKMVSIKNMLVPILVRDPNSSGEAVLLRPRYENEKQMAKFNSSPFPFNLIESIWGQPARNNQEKLFGAAGHHGPELYRDSIKLNTWFVVAQLVFIAGQIVARDLSALAQGVPETVARPDMLLPELGFYGFCVSLLLGQLWLVPKTFLDYSLVTSIERLINAEILSEACVLYGQCDIKFNENDDTMAKANAKQVGGAALSARRAIDDKK